MRKRSYSLFLNVLSLLIVPKEERSYVDVSYRQDASFIIFIQCVVKLLIIPYFCVKIYRCMHEYNTSVF